MTCFIQDHFRKVVDPTFAKVYNDRDRLYGVVEFESYEDLKYAIRKLDDTEFKNRYDRAYIRVVDDSERSPSSSESRSRSRSRSRCEGIACVREGFLMDVCGSTDLMAAIVVDRILTRIPDPDHVPVRAQDLDPVRDRDRSRDRTPMEAITVPIRDRRRHDGMHSVRAVHVKMSQKTRKSKEVIVAAKREGTDRLRNENHGPRRPTSL